MTNSQSFSDDPPDPASSRVVRRVAAAREQDVMQLPQLNDAIDPDALDRLVRSVSAGTTSPMVQFSYADCHVTVGATGDVRCTRETELGG